MDIKKRLHEGELVNVKYGFTNNWNKRGIIYANIDYTIFTFTSTEGWEKHNSKDCFNTTTNKLNNFNVLNNNY